MRQRHCFDNKINLMYEWDNFFINLWSFRDTLRRHLDHLGLSQLLLTPWSRVLTEHLTVPQKVKKFLAVSGTRRFITAFTNASHLSLNLSHSSTFDDPHPTSWRLFLILSIHQHLGLPRDMLVSLFPTHNLLSTSPVPYTCYMPLLSHSSCFDHLKNI